MTIIETWFIPFDILMIMCTTLVMILSILFIFIIILDKTCHTVPMILVANSCLIGLAFGCSLLSQCIFALENDLKQIEYQDSLCIARAYFVHASGAIINYSFLIQALYRYATVVYPRRLFWQSARFQILAISTTWIFGLLYPTVFMFNGAIVYNIANQICELPAQPTFSLMYMVFCTYLIPMSMTMLIYSKLVRYVRAMGKRVTPVNTLLRAQRQLKMVQRTVILISILLLLGIPSASFILMSIFISPPKYGLRIGRMFIDVSLVFVMIALFQFTDPLKASMMKKIKRRSNRVVAAIT